MIDPSTPHPSTTAFHVRALLRKTTQTTFSLLLMYGALSPSGLLANTLNPQKDVTLLEEATFLEEVTLPRWADPASITGPERLGDQRIQTMAEEASKRAQTEYLAKKFRLQRKAVRQYVDLAWAEAERRDGIAPELLIAIMQKESSLRPRVRSRYGAQGLMQVVRRWHREKLTPSESLLDPAVNIRVGADILEEYLELSGGNLTKALRKYSGNARGYTHKILKESRKLADIADQAIAVG